MRISQPDDVIPGPRDPWSMSFSELAIAISICEPGTARACALEAEMKRRVLAEEAAEPRHPPVIVFLAGALVAITAFYFGAAIRGLQPQQHQSSIAMQAPAHR